MSWYLANEKEIIDQFASGQGLSDLSEAVAAHGNPALKYLFEHGVSARPDLCIVGLADVAKATKDASVKSTAEGMAKLLRGQTLVAITQGFEDSANDDSFVEDVHGLESPRRTANKSAPKRPIVRKAAKNKAASKKDRAWFEEKVAGLKAEAEKLPAERQEEFTRKLREERER
jgi:hypothetical protein